MITKYSKIRRIVLFVLSAMFVLALCFGIMSSKNFANADEYEIVVNGNLSERYYEGEILKIPDAECKKGSESVPVTTTVKFPDGSEKIVNEIELTSTGSYTVVHKAIAGGKVITETAKFDVVQKLYGVDNITGSSEIQEYLFDESGCEKYTNSTKKGLMTVIPAGANFVYNKIIDLNGYTKDDILFDANVISSETDKFDFMQFNIRLTDVYDSSNYVTVEYYASSSDKSGAYMRASASCQGKATSNSHSERNTYGVYSYCSFANHPAYSSSWYDSRANDTVRFSFDYENQTLYGNRYTATNGKGVIPIVSLNDTSRFSIMWDGFTTGEVILSCFVTQTDSSYESTKAQLTGAGQGTILINMIDGDNVDVIGDNYSFKDNYYQDNVGPKLDLDLGEYTTETLPEAVVGYNYPVYPASAVDVGSGVRSFTTKVYLGYYTSNPIGVTVKDNQFMPQYPGSYTIEYKAIDYFGNETIKLVDLRCVPSAGFEIELADDGGDAFITGNPIKIKSASTVNQSGTSTISAVAEGKDASGNPVIYPINMKDLTFVSMFDGEFAIKYTAIDYVGRTVQQQYVINIVKAEKPVFIDRPEFIKNFVQGFDYQIPVATAYDFHAGKYVETKVFYKEGIDGEEKELIGSTYTPTITTDLEDFTLYLRYEAVAERDGTIKEVLPYEINCASVYAYYEGTDSTFVDRKTMFDINGDATVEYRQLNVNSDFEYAVYSATSDASIEYINPLSAIDLSTYFSIFTSNFDELVFRLTDADDKNNAIELRILNNDAQSVKATPTGGLQVALKTMNFYNPGHTYNIMYHFDEKAFQVADGSERLIVKTNLAGKEFTGFTNNKVYLTIEFVGVDEGKTADLMITEVNGFYLYNFDWYEPSVLVKIDFDFNSPYHINKETVIPAAVVLDAVNGGLVSTLTLQDPSGATVTTVDGILLQNVSVEQDYTVVFTEYGNYTLYYDVPGYGTIREVLRVVDIQRPVLTVTDALKSEVSVGTTIKLDATVTDDSGLDCEIVVAVFDEMFTTETVVNGADYTFDKAGKYIILFTAYDAAGNCTISRHEVKVK